MTKSLLSAALIVGFGVAAFAPQAANASDGTITFSGKINAETCTVTIDGGTANETVTLPTVSPTAFGTPATLGATAGWTAFTFQLAACDTANATAKVVPYFEHGPNVDMKTGYLKNTATGVGAATNVEIILSSDGTLAGKVDLSKRAGAQSPPTLAVLASGNPAFIYYAGYVMPTATPPTAGDVTATVTYSLSYN